MTLRQKIEKVPRNSQSQANDIIDQIAPLKNLLVDATRHMQVDETKSIMYYSRFKKEPGFKKEKREDNDKKADHLVTLLDEDSCGVDREEVTGTLTNTQLRRKRKMSISLATLASKQWRREKVVMNGAIPLLSSLCLISDIQIQKSCAAAFAFLSLENSIRIQIINEGAFTAIVTLSNSSSKSVKMDCCRALCNLCLTTAQENRAIRENTPFAVHQIAMACPEAIDNCLKVLLNISCVQDKLQRLDEITDAILHIATNLTTAQELLQLKTLCNLSAIKNNQLRLVEDGALNPVAKAAKSLVEEIRVIGATIVRNLSSDPRSRAKMVDYSVLQVLMCMCRDESETTRSYAAQTLLNLSKDVGSREKIVSANSVTAIVRMIGLNHTGCSVDMGRVCSRTLRILSGDAAIAPLIVRDGIVKAIMMLSRAKDEIIQQNCAESICCLFQVNCVLPKLVNQGAVGVLVALAQSTNNIVTGEWCSFALFHLSTSSLMSVPMLSNGLLPSVLKLCNDASSTRTKYFCTAALAYLTRRKDFDCASCIPVFVYLLSEEDNAATLEVCAHSLLNLCCSDDNCQGMLESGALKPVVKLTKTQHMNTKMKCAAILSRLSLYENYYYQFQQDNVLLLLLQLLSVDHTLTQRRVILALSNLTQNQELRVKLLGLNPMPYITLLATKPDEQLRRGCVAIVCNLSYDAGSEEAIVKGGVVSTLLITALVTSDKVASKIICMKAVVNLMANPNLYGILVHEKTIWGCGTLSSLDNMEMLSLCITVICKLSHEFAAEILATPSAIKCVMKAIQQKDLHIMLLGGRTLTNILVHTTVHDKKFHSSVIENMSVFASHTNEEVRELSIICLCLASRSESCRSSIVSSGILRHIDACTIFSKHSVGYAYVTMFGNIASNPLMCAELVDDQCVDRFNHICKSTDSVLLTAVIRTLYCLSLCTANIVKLIPQNVVSLFRHIVESDTVKSLDNIRYYVAALYNLTTCIETQAAIVSQGIVALLADLWPLAIDDYSSSLLVCTAVCHLGCGVVNTTRMIEDGCVPILSFITSNKHNAKYNTYYFDSDMHERCAATYRNLLLVVANQQALVEHMVIESLVFMATMSCASAMDRPGFGMMHDNCTAALRSMTYNALLRPRMANTRAIKVIMSSMADERGHSEGDDVFVGHHLQCELEAESWENGSRGRVKDGRAVPMEPCPVYVELLGVHCNIVVHTSTQHEANTPKQLVHVQLEAEVDELDEQNVNFNQGISDLTVLDDTDDPYAPVPMSYPKQSCNVSDASLLNLHRTKSIEEEEEELPSVSRQMSGAISSSIDKGGSIDEPSSISSPSGKALEAEFSPVRREVFAPLPSVHSPIPRIDSAPLFRREKVYSEGIEMPTSVMHPSRLNSQLLLSAAPSFQEPLDTSGTSSAALLLTPQSKAKPRPNTAGSSKKFRSLVSYINQAKMQEKVKVNHLAAEKKRLHSSDPGRYKEGMRRSCSSKSSTSMSQSVSATPVSESKVADDILRRWDSISKF